MLTQTEEPKKHKQEEVEEVTEVSAAFSKIRRHDQPVEPSAHQVKPFFRRHFPSYMHADAGSTVRLEAFLEPKDDPSMQVFLFKDEAAVQALSPEKINILFNAGYVSVCITGLTAEDGGTWKCLARNQAGSCETNVNLKVISQASVIADTGAQQFRPTPVPATQSTFTQQQQISTVKTLRSSQIRQVSAPQMASVPAPGPAHLAPIFRIPLHIPPLLYAEGETIHMEAFLEPVADPSLRLDWFHNGAPLDVLNEPRLRPHFDFGRLSLAVTGATVEDSGEYTVVASSPYGQAHSTATVAIVATGDRGGGSVQRTEQTIRYQSVERSTSASSRRGGEVAVELASSKPPHFVSKFNNIRVAEGKTACLEARVEPAESSEDLVVDWFFEGRPLKVGNRFQPYTHFGWVVLKIAKAQPDDSGLYSCRIGTRQLGVTDEASASILCIEETVEEYSKERVVEVVRSGSRQSATSSRTTFRAEESLEMRPAPPKFSGALRDMEVVEGEKVHLEVFLKVSEEYSGNDLVVEWFKDERPLQKGSRFVEINDFGYVCLDILYAYPEDSGVYSVVARNRL